MTSERVMEFTCATARVAGESLPVNCVPASAEDVYTTTQHISARLSALFSWHFGRENRPMGPGGGTPTVRRYSQEEDLDDAHKHVDTTTTRCAVEQDGGNNGGWVPLDTSSAPVVLWRRLWVGRRHDSNNRTR